MKQSKKIAWSLARDMTLEELADKETVSEQLRIMVGVSDDFRDTLAEVGINEIAKQCRKIAEGFRDCLDEEE